MISVGAIRRDGGTQPRESLDLAVVAEYAERIAAGDTFPPVTVYFDGTDYWLADGFHRVAAAERSGLTEIEADVRQGDRADAVWASCSANAIHGLRRTNEDKRRAVRRALEMRPMWSDRAIAAHCGVSQPFVTKVRTEMTDNGYQWPAVRTGLDGRTIDTSNINARPEMGRPGEGHPEPAPGRLLVRDPAGPEFSRPGEGDSEPVPGWLAVLDPAAGQAPEIQEPRRPGGVPAALIMSESNEWYTPAEYVDAARDVMGAIDLDPASCAQANETVQAGHFFCEADDGLSRPWLGRVWLNPPYGRNDDNESNQGVWSAALLERHEAGDVVEAVLLVNAVTDRAWFRPLWRHAICFVAERIKFYAPDGRKPQPTHGNVLVYLGPKHDSFAARFARFGQVVLPSREGVSLCR